MAKANPVEVEIDHTDFYENVKEYNFTDCKCSLLVVGPCGAGKSAFCNFLLKEKQFTEAMGFLAVTEKADYCIIPGIDGDMLVVDCPGFCDPKRSHEEIMKEISKASILCRAGMDAVGIMIDPTSRFTETQKISYEQIDSIGGNFWKHAFIIFNREKKIEKSFGNADEYIQGISKDPKCPAELKELLNKVDNRFIFVESKKRCGDEDYWCKIRDNLVAMIMQIKENNAGGLYMNTLMKYGQAAYKSLLEVSNTMAQTMGKMKVRMEKQNSQIMDLEKKIKVLERSKFAVLRDIFYQRIAEYETKIGKLTIKSPEESKEKSTGWGCSVM